MTTYPAPIQLGQTSEKFHFLVEKHIQACAGSGSKHNSNGESVAKTIKKSIGLKGNHTNIGKTVAPK